RCRGGATRCVAHKILVVAMYLPVFHLGDAIGGAGG
ncbi:hypothetical protein, partial [Klebsiella pneumoniae]